MSVKLIAIYSTPQDVQAFEQHYRDVHTPIALNIPKLISLEVNRVKKVLGGVSDVYMIAELLFADQAAFAEAAQSDEFKAAGADLANFAAGRVSMLLVEA